MNWSTPQRNYWPNRPTCESASRFRQVDVSRLDGPVRPVSHLPPHRASRCPTSSRPPTAYLGTGLARHRTVRPLRFVTRAIRDQSLRGNDFRDLLGYLRPKVGIAEVV